MLREGLGSWRQSARGEGGRVEGEGGCSEGGRVEGAEGRVRELEAVPEVRVGG